MKAVEATRLAMNAVSEAKRDERRQRMVDLYAAAVQLQTTVMRAQYLDDEDPPEGEVLSWHEWLVREVRWLDANQSSDPAFVERESRYLRRVFAYQEAADVVSAALEIIADASRSPSMPKPKTDVWRQLGEAPF